MTNTKSSMRTVSKGLNTIKFFIVTLMLTITVGVWSKLSQEKTPYIPTQVLELSSPLPSAVGLDLPPIPTLVALENINTSIQQSVSVNQPTIIQPQAPLPTVMFQQNQPITNTGSSR